ncbi:MAG TPA: glycerol-3-phosphate dehydrogenase/oxidase [Candidatus Brocadiia bacterium]|nr:glycerol-3-phosphate dehydrogenase/oxidase [Candidatus Brocadiia bacterium]
MERFIENYSGQEFDLVIIGGGITGAAVAYDAALRGLSVALVEKQDFGCATSSATSKLIHGGFRYLANFEFGLVRESLRERRNLENIAPNFVYPLPCIFTCYNQRLSNDFIAVATGMFVYDLLSYDKGRTWDKGKAIPSHRIISPAEALRLEPNIRPGGLKGCGIQYDCASLFPERLTLAFIRSAVKAGARVANYARVEEFLASDGHVHGVKVRDVIAGRTMEVRGKLTVNCGGPWADIVLGLLEGPAGEKKLRRSEGIHIITRKIINDHLIACIGRSGGHFFLIPWRGHTLIGTTDKEYIGDPDEYRVTRKAITELIDEVNSGFGKEPLKYEDVLHAYGGLRPLVEDQTKGVYESSRKYEIHDNGREGFEGLITVEGGKYTTSRNLAENAMKMIGRKLNRSLGRCETANRHLAGCEIDDIGRFVSDAVQKNGDFDSRTVDWMARHYGTEFNSVLDLARNDRALAETLDADGELLAQAVFAVREEMALTLKDVIMRRTGLGGLGHPGDDVIRKVAGVVAAELGWDDERREKEISQANEALTLPG